MQERGAALAAPVVAAMLVAALTGLTGCGGDGGRLGAAGFRHRAEAICSRAARATTAVDLPDMDDHRAASAMHRIVEIERGALADLRDLEPPHALESGVEVWLATVDQLVDEADFLRDSLAHGDHALVQAVGTRTARLSLRAEKLGTDLGISGCTLPSPPPVDPTDE